MKEIDCEMQDFPTCPYCGETEADYYDVSEGGSDITCGSCGKDYHCTRNVQIDFTSEILPDKNKEENK